MKSPRPGDVKPFRGGANKTLDAPGRARDTAPMTRPEPEQQGPESPEACSFRVIARPENPARTGARMGRSIRSRQAGGLGDRAMLAR